MAANLAKAGAEVHAFDLVGAAVDRAVAAGCRAAPSAAEAVKARRCGHHHAAGGKPRARRMERRHRPQRAAGRPGHRLFDHRRRERHARWPSWRPARVFGPPTRRSPAASWPPTPEPWRSWSAARTRLFSEVEAVLAPMARAVIHAGAAGCGAGGQDLQQHGARRLDAGRLRSLRPGREAGPGAGAVLRDRLASRPASAGR